MLALEHHGADTYVGESPSYEWGRIYGGLVIAQALRAAAHTVDSDGHAVHSLHAYFILGGNPAEPVRYEVARLRNGRSFTTRQVVARQSGGAILNLSASFQRPEEGPDVSSSVLADDVAPPDGLEPLDWGIGLDARVELESTDPARHRMWARYTDPISSDPDDHYAALAYLSDTNATDAVLTAHPVQRGGRSMDDVYMTASLDHAIWFHRPVRADEWLMFDLRPHQIIGTRGLATGDVFTAAGELVATVAQQGLVRLRK
ncbi:MAG TPA: acyl-CoA thioesterase II [Acidimicrobiaceae bacterium]|nr:acyl-CoA thioesterase II [Acidimicrobiaceae bacterium]